MSRSTWRVRRAHYRLIGGACFVCGIPLFPPRSQCLRCAPLAEAPGLQRRHSVKQNPEITLDALVSLIESTAANNNLQRPSQGHALLAAWPRTTSDAALISYREVDP